MADEDELQLQEALRRSIEQTNLQESQLADALAESVRTHDHEIALDMQRNHLAQIEQDLMTQPRLEREQISRDMETQLLSDRSVVETEEREWQVVGNRNINPPRYIPLEVEKGVGPSSSRNNIVKRYIVCNTSEQTKGTSDPLTHSNVYRASRSHGKVPYRPPNLHRSDSSTPSATDHILPATTSNPLNQTVNGPKSIPVSAIPQYRRPVVRQTGMRQHTRVASTTNEPLVVIDGQNVGCSYGAGGVSRFRAKGVEVVLDFYFNQGITAVAMLPRNKVDTRSNIVNDRVADDPDLLKKLEDQGRLAFTPAGVHDDHFLLSYAMNKGIDIISNDRFQKEVSEQETETDARKLRDFLTEHLIPYTFVNGEFFPNPKVSQLGRSIHHSRTRN